MLSRCCPAPGPETRDTGPGQRSREPDTRSGREAAGRANPSARGRDHPLPRGQSQSSPGRLRRRGPAPGALAGVERDEATAQGRPAGFRAWLRGPVTLRPPAVPRTHGGRPGPDGTQAGGGLRARAAPRPAAAARQHSDALPARSPARLRAAPRAQGRAGEWTPAGGAWGRGRRPRSGPLPPPARGPVLSPPPSDVGDPLLSPPEVGPLPASEVRSPPQVGALRPRSGPHLPPPQVGLLLPVSGPSVRTPSDRPPLRRCCRVAESTTARSSTRPQRKPLGTVLGRGAPLPEPFEETSP